MNSQLETKPTQSQPVPRLYALPDILARGKFSKSHVYNLIARGQFPKPALVLGPRFTRWDQEVDIWFASPSAWITAHAETVVPV
jgi:predicted DNA-binding transcriptional regulator AlpA